MRRLVLAAGALLLATSLAGGAGAQEGGLSPTLAAIKRTNVVRLGYR